MNSKLIAEASLESSAGGATLISLELYACCIKSGENGMRGGGRVELRRSAGAVDGRGPEARLARGQGGSTARVQVRL